MKTFVDGSTWTEPDDRGVIRIGFRQSYIEQVLGECFHVVQADTRKARKGCPLMVLETNDGTSRVRSPVTGTILTFSDKARNFPDRLTEDDVIVEVLPEGVTLPPRSQKTVASKNSGPDRFAEAAMQFGDLFAQAAEARHWFEPEPQVAPIVEDEVAARQLREHQHVLEVQARNALAANRRARRPR
jgi:glycine cleavage system H lipoate-binding protein